MLVEDSSQLSLASRNKEYEASNELVIPYNETIIVRVDGHRFSKFTKKLKKPFDTIFSNAMKKTTEDLMKTFGAVTGYTQSDEITLVILPCYKEVTKMDGFYIDNNQIYKGRTQKLASLISSTATASFNKAFFEEFEALLEKTRKKHEDNFRETPEEEADYKYVSIIRSKLFIATFDTRVFGVPTLEEAFNSVMWRVRDCIKNSISVFAQTYCSSKKSLLNKNGPEQIKFCLETTGKDWKDLEDKYKYGILIKKQAVEIDIPKEYLKYQKGNETKAIRNEFVSYSIPLTNFSEDNVKLITCRKIGE